MERSKFIIIYELVGKPNFRKILYSRDSLKEIDDITLCYNNSDELKLKNKDEIMRFLEEIHEHNNTKNAKEYIKLYEYSETYIEENEYCSYDDFIKEVESLELRGIKNYDYEYNNGIYTFRYLKTIEKIKQYPILYKSYSKLLPFNECKKKVLSKFEERDIEFLNSLLEKHCKILSKDQEYYLRKSIIGNMLDNLKYEKFLKYMRTYLNKSNEENLYRFYRLCMNKFDLVRNIKPKNLNVHLNKIPLETKIEYPNRIQELYDSGRYEELFNEHSLEEISLYVDLDNKGRKR